MSDGLPLDIRFSPNQYKRTPESYVLHACLDYLNAEHIWAVRMNTGSIAVTAKNGKSRAVSFGTKGMADILSMPCLDLYQLGRIVPVPLWIECKQRTGKLSPYQINFRDWVTSNGQFYLVARDSEDIANWLKSYRRMQ